MKRYCFLRLFYQLFSYVKVKNFLTSPIRINLFLKFKPYEAFVTKRIEPITFFKNEHLHSYFVQQFTATNLSFLLVDNALSRGSYSKYLSAWKNGLWHHLSHRINSTKLSITLWHDFNTLLQKRFYKINIKGLSAVCWRIRFNQEFSISCDFTKSISKVYQQFAGDFGLIRSSSLAFLTKH